MDRRPGLLLIGHGSRRHPDAAATLQALAATLRSHPRFASVAVGLLATPPTPSEALESLGRRRIHLIPLFMDDGHFARLAVPAVPPPNLIAHRPLGLHPGLAAVIAARVRRTAPDQPPPAILLVGHGSARTPGRRRSAHDHADTLRRTGAFPAVETAFLEEPPDIATALHRIGDRPTVAVGLFLAEGLHARDDLPDRLRTAAADRRHKPIAAGIIGDDPGLIGLILDAVAPAKG